MNRTAFLEEMKTKTVAMDSRNAVSQKIPIILADLGIDPSIEIHLEAHRELALSA
jgi:hypothetical protein